MKTTTLPRCSCGASEDHVIMTRQTWDFVTVRAYHNGDIANESAIYARGLPTDLQRIVMGELTVYDEAEVRILVRAARKAWKATMRDGSRVSEDEVRRLMRVYAAVMGSRNAKALAI